MASIPEDEPPPVIITPFGPPPPNRFGEQRDLRSRGVAKIHREANTVTEEDVIASTTLRGLFANRLYVEPSQDGLTLRLSFAETAGGHAVYHTAIVVPTFDASGFGELITKMAEQSLDFLSRQAPSTPEGDQDGQ